MENDIDLKSLAARTNPLIAALRRLASVGQPVAWQKLVAAVREDKEGATEGMIRGECAKQRAAGIVDVDDDYRHVTLRRTPRRAATIWITSDFDGDRVVPVWAATFPGGPTIHEIEDAGPMEMASDPDSLVATSEAELLGKAKRLEEADGSPAARDRAHAVVQLLG